MDLHNTIAEGLASLVTKASKAPIIKRPVLEGIESFRHQAEKHELIDHQIGEVALLVYNEFRQIIGREKVQLPRETPTSSEITSIVARSMKSVEKILSSKVPGIPIMARGILSEVVNRCEELVREHQLEASDIEMIGMLTWQKVKEVSGIPGAADEI
jgi:hypothetical protein